MTAAGPSTEEAVVVGTAAGPPVRRGPRGRRGRRGRRFAALAAAGRHRLGGLELAGLIGIAVVTLLLLAAPVLLPHSERAVVADPFSAPGAAGLLGTDSQGRDVLSRVVLGLRASWFGTFAVIAFGMVVGGAVGLVAGTLGGPVDAVLMRLTDAALALPGTLVAVVVVAALGPSLQHTLVALAVTWWPWYARLVRGQTRATVHLPHVEAARLGGFSRTRIALVHVLPASFGLVLVAASLDLGGVLLTLAALSFIGLGSPPPAAEIGSMTADGLQYLFNAPWIAIVPGVALFLVALLANLAGDGLRDVVE